MKYSLLTFVALLFCLSLVAQDQDVTPGWNMEYQWLFDNREYESEYAISQTIFGSRLAPELSLNWGDNSVNVGAEVFVSMGKDKFFDRAVPLTYYNYDNGTFDLSAGIVPKSKMRGDYPTAFFSDSVKYYDPIIEGCLLSYGSRRGYVEAGISWVGFLTEDTRERFILFSSAQINRGKFIAGYYITVMHYAMYKDSYGVVDNILVLPYVGLRFGKQIEALNVLTIRAGALMAVQRDREMGGAMTPSGLYVDLNARRGRLGVDGSLYLGSSIMPFYDCYSHDGDYYGSSLYYGDSYYRTGDIYSRLKLYWEAVKTKRMTLQLSSVHHFDGQVFDWQQVVSLKVSLGGGF